MSVSMSDTLGDGVAGSASICSSFSDSASAVRSTNSKLGGGRRGLPRALEGPGEFPDALLRPP